MSKSIYGTSGEGNTPFATIFRQIKARCENPKHERFNRYGGRGIKCLWGNFKEFKDDMFKSYQIHIKIFGRNNTTIDRINNNGHYCKENCRWATQKEQARNRNDNFFIEFQGKKKTIAEWAEIQNIKISTLWRRIKRKWPTEKAITTPVRHYIV